MNEWEEVSTANCLATIAGTKMRPARELPVYCCIITSRNRVYAENAITGKGKPGIESCFQNLPRTLVPTLPIWMLTMVPQRIQILLLIDIRGYEGNRTIKLYMKKSPRPSV